MEKAAEKKRREMKRIRELEPEQGIEIYEEGQGELNERNELGVRRGKRKPYGEVRKISHFNDKKHDRMVGGVSGRN